MKIQVTSDFHGILPHIENKFDLLIVCGDVCPAHDHYTWWQYDWVLGVFTDWINNLPFLNENSRVFLTWGNHDFFDTNYIQRKMENPNNAIGRTQLENELNMAMAVSDELKRKTNGRAVVLNHKLEVFDDGVRKISVFGTPYCKKFYNWAFMFNNGFLKERFDEIPSGVDILFTHDAPTLNGLGTISEGFQYGKDAGNPIIDKAIERVEPKYYFCGHIHSGNHNFEMFGGTMMANVSLVNENYDEANSPIEFEI